MRIALDTLPPEPVIPADFAPVNGNGHPAYAVAEVSGPVLTRLSSVQPQEINWLWPQRIAIGKLTLLCGDPGLGKSFLTIYLASIVSAGGVWADSSHGMNELAGEVILLNAEDDIADTIRPRLDAAGADVDRVHCLEGVRWVDDEGVTKIRSFTLDDLPNLEDALKRTPGTRLVCIDPVSAYLGGNDSHKNAEIRGLLAPLAKIASTYRVAVVIVTHLSKSGSGRAMYRAMGSLAFVAAARTAWVVAKDQEDADRRLFLPIKNNVGNDRDGLAYRITNGAVAWEPGIISTSADEAIGGDGSDTTRKAPVRDAAADWLKELLSNGPMTASDVSDHAKAAMIASKTLRMAREQLGIVPYRGRGSMNEPWYWTLPPPK